MTGTRFWGSVKNIWKNDPILSLGLFLLTASPSGSDPWDLTPSLILLMLKITGGYFLTYSDFPSGRRSCWVDLSYSGFCARILANFGIWTISAISFWLIPIKTTSGTNPINPLIWFQWLGFRFGVPEMTPLFGIQCLHTYLSLWRIVRMGLFGLFGNPGLILS